MLSILLLVLSFLILTFFIISVLVICKEDRKLKINPVPKLKNNDKRFADITSEYCHSVYDVKRGK